ncbi:MAG: M20/M25/M40 family metallo-hydrolase [Vicinamibacteria bacterium]|nr:M20/M25/M40 family metallo-hydrolase [Vicinamibacteria bacterium]
MKAHRVCIAVAAALYLGSGAALPQAPMEADERVDRIVGMAMARGGAYAFLQRLTDSIGGRVTGSAESRAAADLLVSTLREAGLEDAHFEEYALESRWQHGRAVGRVVSPVARSLAVRSYGWVPGTRGEVTASLVDLGARANDGLAVPSERVRGAAVIVEPRAAKGAPAQVVRAALAHALARAGAAAMLIPSDKPHRMLYTSAFGFYPGGPMPVLSVAREDVLFLRRLLASEPVRVTLDVANTFDASPAQERNVVAEITGTTPGEVVLVGAHFDSWDPGQGAQDDGVGVAAILEAARILKSLGIRPRRTIRFVFFSGEEQGLLGSRAYIETHRAELDGLRAAVIMDSGAQTPRGFMIHGRSDIEAATRSVLAPLAALGASGVSLEASFDMDHGPFLAAGVPVFTLWVDEGEYDTHHHAISDTFDKVDPHMLALDTAVMAVAAYRLADAADAPARRLSAAEATHLLETLGLESLRRAVYEPGGSR